MVNATKRTIEIEAYKAVVEWRELWRILNYRDGFAWDREWTGFHIRPDEAVPDDHMVASISAKPGTIVSITPWE